LAQTIKHNGMVQFVELSIGEGMRRIVIAMADAMNPYSSTMNSARRRMGSALCPQRLHAHRRVAAVVATIIAAR